VTITANAGSVSGQTIQTLGVAGSPNTYGSGGNVSVTATTGINITGNQINTDAVGPAAITSAQAGTVSLSTTGGNIIVGPVYSRGTPSQALQTRNGGTVYISAPAGSVTATGVIQAQGVIGGNITLSGSSGVSFQGAIDNSSGAAPNGGTVTLSATGYPVSDNSTGYVKTDVLNISANGVTLNNSSNNVASLSIVPNGTSPISYWDADAFSLGPLTFSGTGLTLTLKSVGGNITQSGPLVANGAGTLTSLDSGVGNITLQNAGNNFDQLSVTSTGAVAIQELSSVTIMNTTAGSFNLSAGADVSIAGNVSGLSTSAAGGISVSTAAGNISVAEGVTAALGNIAFTAGGADKELAVNSFFTVQATTGNVNYAADNVSLLGMTTSGSASDKFIEVKPFSAATAIEFSAVPDSQAPSPTVLRLSSTELATLTTPMLKVGNISNTGGIQFKQAVTLAPGKVPALSLITSGAIGQDSTANVSVNNLNAHGMAGVALNEANYVSVNLAGRTGTGAFSFSNGSNSIQVGPVDVVNNGIVSDSGGALSLATTLGSISTVGTGIIKTAGTLSANSYAGMSLKTEVGTLNAVDSGTSADVVVSNSGANAPILTLGTLTPGTGRRWLIYVDDPSKLVKAGKTSDFREYGKTYPSAPLPANAGKGFIYASAPGQLQVNTTLQSGIASNTFGVAPTAVFGYSITNPSGADSEDLAIATAGTAGFTPTVTGSTNAGAYTITYAGGKTHPVYSVVAGTGLAYTVNAAPVSVNTLSLSGSRVYDGTDVVNGSIFSISGLVGSDTLVLSGSGTVADKNVGVNKPVTLGTLALGNGTGLASNYTLTGGTHVATITKAPITGVTGITATNRSYDGTLVAALTTSGAVLAGMAANDNLGVTSAKGAFENKNVGDAKAVNVSDLVFGGTDVDNYTFSSATASPTKANITPRPLSTWKGPSNGGNWSDPTNWDALPDASNVTSVALPSAGTVVYDAAMGSTTLQSMSGAGTLAVAGGSLTVATAVSLQGYQQTAGALATQGAVTVANSYSQTGGTVVAGGAVAITQASGDLAVGSITAPTISLKANGSITQTDGLVTAGLLSTQSGGGTVLNSAANRVSAFQAASTGAGNIEFTNLGALDVRGLRTASGSIVMRNTGGISTSGPVVARGGKITGVANSPLTIGPDGVSADGDISLIATNLTSAGNITLNGPVVSSGGAIAVTAAANLTQNSTVSAALGVTAQAGGTTVFGPAASTVGSPVSYANSGVPTSVPEAPKTVVQEQFIQLTQSRVTVDLVETFSARFEQAVAAQEEAKAPPGSPLRKKKEEENTVVAEAPICPR
jgi:hypothetical protein